MSAGLIWTSTSSASGITATVAVEVWMRPCASVAGTRCTRCTPDSYLRKLKTPCPEMVTLASLMPPAALSLESINVAFQPLRSA
jgi:hypothetical protein